MATNRKVEVCVAACKYLRVQAKMTFAGRGTAAGWKKQESASKQVNWARISNGNAGDLN